MKEKFERRKRIERRGERGSWGEKFERRRNLNLISKGKKKEDGKDEEEQSYEKRKGKNLKIRRSSKNKGEEERN